MESPLAHALKSKRRLLEFAYQEVLDATKHQDDKIGRLLTAIAFLTASSVAVANMNSGAAVQQRFRFSQETPHSFALYGLALFLLGVIATVLLLVSSLATPLRFPGISSTGYKKSNSNKFENRDDVENYIRGTSPIYFAGISRLSEGEWEKKWTHENWGEINFDSALVTETHNLAARANTKYGRTSEAMAIFSFSLLAYAISIFFVFLAVGQGRILESGSPQLPIDLGYFDRSVIGVIFLIYVWIQLYSRYRYDNRLVGYDAEPEQHRYLKTRDARLKRLFYLTSGSVLLSVYSLMMLIGSSIEKITLIVELILTFGIYLISNSIINGINKEDIKDFRKEFTVFQEFRVGLSSSKKSVLWQILAFLLAIGFIIAKDSYVVQISYCVALIFVVTFRTGLESTLILKAQKVDYEKRENTRFMS